MKNYIFDKEKDCFLTDDDGARLSFHEQNDVYKFLKSICQFTDDWIKTNFRIMRAYQILIPEDLPEFYSVKADLCDKCGGEMNEKGAFLICTNCDDESQNQC